MLKLKDTYFHRVSRQTPTGMWINNVTAEEARLAIESGAVGCTQNPSYPWKMLNHSKGSQHARELLMQCVAQHEDDDMAQTALQRMLVAEIARVFLPLYEESGGRQGYVSIQGKPPARRPGRHPAVRTLQPRGRAKHHGKNSGHAGRTPRHRGTGRRAGAHQRHRGDERATDARCVRGVYPRYTRLACPAPLYFSHIAGIFDEYIAKGAVRDGVDIPKDYLWQAGIAVAKKIDQAVRENKAPVGFISGGARGLHHFTEMVGCAAVVTINWQGTAEELILQDPPVVQRFLQPTPHSVTDALCDALPDFRKAYFADAIAPEEYEEYGPVALFRESFEDAWRNALSLIADMRGATR